MELKSRDPSHWHRCPFWFWSEKVLALVYLVVQSTTRAIYTPMFIGGVPHSDPEIRKPTKRGQPLFLGFSGPGSTFTWNPTKGGNKRGPKAYSSTGYVRPSSHPGKVRGRVCAGCKLAPRLWMQVPKLTRVQAWHPQASAL